MIDPKLLREDFEGVKQRLATRGLPENIDNYPVWEKERRTLLKEVEQIRAEKNKVGPEIAKRKKTGGDASDMLERMKAVGQREKELDCQLDSLEKKLTHMHLIIPNTPHESVPVGEGEEENRFEKDWGEKPSFSFEPKSHWDIGEALGILDFKTAATLSGSRFAIYRGDGAKLERALISFMLDHHTARKYMEILPPVLVREETMVRSGQLPKFREEAFKTDEFTPQLFLIPTAEVVLCNLHTDTILEVDMLPLYYTAYSACFRAEAGSYGKDVRGLIRQHQFNKVELVKMCVPETSYDELETLTVDAESILEKLGLAYRRVTLSTGDMGLAAAKTYDLEVWLPGQDRYREISSCSNTTDYQSRRTKTRFRRGPKEKPELVHMLNGSGLAVGRTLVAILENYQQEDGSVVVPEVLRPYFSGQQLIS